MIIKYKANYNTLEVTELKIKESEIFKSSLKLDNGSRIEIFNQGRQVIFDDKHDAVIYL